MPKPFRVDPQSAGIVRRSDGKFAREDAVPSPAQLVNQAERQDRPLPEVLEENRAAVSQGKIPWGPPETPRNPMKLDK